MESVQELDVKQNNKYTFKYMEMTHFNSSYKQYWLRKWRKMQFTTNHNFVFKLNWKYFKLKKIH